MVTEAVRAKSPRRRQGGVSGNLRRSLARPAQLLLAAALPWTWFVLRDTLVVFEWVAILLPLLAGLAVIGMLFLAGLIWPQMVAGARALVACALSLSVMATVAVVTPWTPMPTEAPQRSVRILAANVWGNNTQHTRLAGDLLRAGADVVVASELTPILAPVVEALDTSYPYRFGGPYDEVRVWSTYPIRGAKLPADLVGANGAQVVVDAPAGPFLLYALHLQRPSRRALGEQVTVAEQDRLVRRLNAYLAAADLPVVVAGDLNLTDRGAAFRRLAAHRRDAMRTGWVGPTSLRARNRPLMLRIDHVLIPSDWCAAGARRIPLSGSDHRGLLTEIGPCT